MSHSRCEFFGDPRKSFRRFYPIAPKALIGSQNGSNSSSFPLEARKNKSAILANMADLFSEPKVRAPREKIISNTNRFQSQLGLTQMTRGYGLLGNGLNSSENLSSLLEEFTTRMAHE